MIYGWIGGLNGSQGHRVQGAALFEATNLVVQAPDLICFKQYCDQGRWAFVERHRGISNANS